MQNNHTVEKIGGTSMKQFDVLLNNLFFNRDNPYNRIFVVSAYAGITNVLLEHKKTHEDGIYSSFVKNNKKEWQEKINQLLRDLININKNFESIGLDQSVANQFITERIEEAKKCLLDLESLLSYGHFFVNDFLMSVRELLSSIGEAHSAFNSVNILKNNGINAIFIDLSAWKDTRNMCLEKQISNAFAGIDLSNTLPIATGYTKCSEGLMQTYDRGYSEITFTKIATLTKAKEGIIHKEYHLCTADPLIVGVDKVKIIGETNFDVADQLADLEMEAIHPKAAKEMQENKIPIRILNCFEHEHTGTTISESYISKTPRVEMICGRKNIVSIEVWDTNMVGISGYDHRLSGILSDKNIDVIAKNTNANTITHYASENDIEEHEIKNTILKKFSKAKVSIQKVAIICCIGSNMSYPNFLATTASILAKSNINILAIGQCMRQINIQFIIERESFEKAVKALHHGVIEKNVSS